MAPGDEAPTYCLNVHPTERWEETRAALLGPVRAVKAAVSPEAPFPVGLRVSARALETLRGEAPREELRDILAREGFSPITMNGFPWGRFHGVAVKADVYLPDWREEARVTYTAGLAELMADINPEGAFLSLSTVPGAYGPRAAGAEALMADNLLRAAAHLALLHERTGRKVALAIEPEPCCFLETVAETVDFFAARLFSGAAEARMAALTGFSRGDAAAALRRHLGLCYDVCHAAVEFEDPEESLAALRGAGIAVHKLQLSSALRLRAATPAARAALARFAEPTYLHQTIVRAPGGLIRFSDLPEALATGAAHDGREWRVHFHVPVFLDTLPDFDTTQGFLREILALHRKEPISRHLEVETYTWDVLPEALRAGAVEAAVAREILWVRERLE